LAINHIVAHDFDHGEQAVQSSFFGHEMSVLRLYDRVREENVRDRVITLTECRENNGNDTCTGSPPWW
jgi:hypothetical protein